MWLNALCLRLTATVTERLIWWSIVLKIKIRVERKDFLLLIVFYLLLFNNPIGSIVPIFNYTDEAFSLLGIAALLWKAVRLGRLKLQRNWVKIIIAIGIFACSGIVGNFIYHYQPLQYVLTDLLVNLKFYLSIITGYLLVKHCNFVEKQKLIVGHAKFVVTCLTGLLFIDQVFHLFPSGEIRYGIRISQLFFTHVTYLVGSVVFLMAVLMLFYHRKNNLCILMCLLLLVFSMRGKALAGAVAFCLILYFMVIYKKKLRAWHVVLITLGCMIVAGEQFLYYYVELEGASARSVMTQTSIQIMKDYFPIGTGFGTYGSHSAAENYSPVYIQYGFLDYYELNGGKGSFFDDTFWPIIFGQTGVIGTVAYLIVLGLLFLRVLRLREKSINAYATGIFLFVYLMISSTSEPAFNNSVSIPLAFLLGVLYYIGDQKEKKAQVIL